MRLAVFCVALLTATIAAAQQPAMEIGIRQGDYYWVVETAPDGSRRGGWVSVNVPVGAIDRNTLKPLPPASAIGKAVTPQAAPPAPPTIDERLARIEQAIAGGQQSVAPAPAAVQPAPQFSLGRQQPAPPTVTPVQRLQTREGFWFNGGMGFGLLGCLECGGGREVGLSGGLSLGGTISDRVLLGVGTTGWYKSAEGLTINGGTFDARLRFYPALSSGFFLTAGGGLGSITASLDDFGLADTEYGAGVLFGLGWDLRVGRNVSLTPYYNGFAMGVASGTFFVDQFGVGITIH
jgi:hypothetical protein